MFRASQHPSSGVLKTVSANSGIAVNKCLHTVASSWTFLLTLNHDARNHEFKIQGNNLTTSRRFSEVIKVLPEDGAVSANKCRRYLVNNTNIQLYMCISLENYKCNCYAKRLYDGRNPVYSEQIMGKLELFHVLLRLIQTCTPNVHLHRVTYHMSYWVLI